MYAKIYPETVSGVVIIKCDLDNFRTLLKEHKTRRFRSWCKGYKVRIETSLFESGYVLISYTWHNSDTIAPNEELNHQRAYSEIRWWIEDVGEIYNYIRLKG